MQIELPNLTAGGLAKKAQSVGTPLGLVVLGLVGGAVGTPETKIGKDGLVDVSPRACFGITEGAIARVLHDGLQELMLAEIAAAPTIVALPIEAAA